MVGFHLLCIYVKRLVSGASQKNACRVTHAAIHKAGLRLNVKISQLPGDDLKGVHVVYLTDFIHYMVDNNELHRIWGGIPKDEIQQILRSFWSRFKAVEPDHEIFRRLDDGLNDAGRTIPLYVHGDEGRGNPFIR